MTVVTRATVTPSGSGSVFLTGWKGWIPTLQNQGSDFQRLGQTGAGAQVTGKRGRKSTCTGWIGFPDFPSAVTFAERWESFEYSIATITDPYNRLMKNVRLTSLSANVIRTRGPSFSLISQVLFRVEVSADCERLPDS